jgi:hypothetical protein
VCEVREIAGDDEVSASRRSRIDLLALQWPHGATVSLPRELLTMRIVGDTPAFDRLEWLTFRYSSRSRPVE